MKKLKTAAAFAFLAIAFASCQHSMRVGGDLYYENSADVGFDMQKKDISE